ncbi:unnamed protein product [Fusarium graminearum]|uniref:Uncharacterized protein n=1 Tax=Gibberella zeae TaxID=5518 RepID=A0A2H3H4F6_GIBZA|nr:hypothetical protein HG531_008371 [Fusarium graminearum]PCD32289.1 hypothetical protein FGRA07_09541 [Fusarium graminearum]CAG1971413.1 unnamed protein product [Fusarium graminearum]CAG2002096.1 unnamed protein product [Fusarium graminearum]CZS74906.1 unnamed protein product [Fusarium graminearum]
MAAQLRLQDSKEKFQAAYDAAVTQKESSEKDWKDEKEAGLHDQGFDQWSAINAPAYTASFQQYQAARAAYEAALHAIDEQAARSWQEKVRQAVIDNKLNYNILIGPDA